MGTRSLTRIIDEDNEQIICMYRQMDGYLSGMGQDLYNFLKDFVIVNGIGINEKRKIANGAGCLAAQLVAHFKDGAGSIYLYPTRVYDCGQEYEYRIYVKEDKSLFIEVLNNDGRIFYGPVAELQDFITEDSERNK